MTSPVPPRDWTDIHWPDIAGGDAARWIAVLPLAATEQHGPHLPLGTDVMIARGLSGAGARTVAGDDSRDLPAAAAGRHFHRAYRLSGHADAADRGRAEGWMALGESVARAGVRKLVMVTSHGGNSAAMTLVAQDLRAQHGLARGHHQLVALRRAGWIVLGGRIAPRHPWRRGRNLDHAGALSAQPCARRRSPIFVPRASRWRRNYRWLSTQRPAPFAWQAQDLHASGAVGDATQASAEKGEKLLDHGARAFCELLAEVDKFDVNRLSPAPKRYPPSNCINYRNN